VGVLIRWWGVVVRPASPPVMSTVVLVAPCGLGGQVFAWLGGPQTRVNSSVQAVSQGQVVGRCRVSRRAEEEIRAGTVMRVRRIVAVLALAKDEPVIVAATRVRLNAMVASTSHAPLAAKRLETSKYHRRPLGPGSFAVPIHRCAAGDAPDSS